MEETDKLIDKSDNLIDDNEEILDNAKDQIFHNPVEKYAIYAKFPFILFFQLLIIIFAMYRLINNTKENEEGRFFKHLVYELFLPLDDDNDQKDKTGFSYQQHLYIYNYEQLKDVLNKSLDSYYTIEEKVIENITYMNRDKEGNASSPIMYVSYLNDKVEGTPGNLSYIIKQDDYGPLQDPDIAKSFINNITSFKIVYYLMAVFPIEGKQQEKYICHKIEQIYNFESLANIDLYLNYNKMKCPNNKFIITNIWLEMLIIISCILSLAFNIFHIVKRYRYYYINKKEEEKKLSEEKKNTSNLLKDKFAKEDVFFNYLIKKNRTINKKFEIFDPWTALAVISSAINIVGALLTICDPLIFNPLTSFITSSGLCLSILLFIKYFENLGVCSIIYDSIKRGLPSSMHFLIGVLPSFFGFCIFGKCIFWRSDFFCTLKDSIATLFALLYADSAYFIFDDLISINFFLGTIFSYGFCILFIVIVMNIFLGIVGEAFVTKKEKKYNQQWIYRILKMEENEKRKKMIMEEEREAEKNKTQKELLQYRLEKIYEEFDNVQKLSVLIISKSTTKNIVELRSKFGEQLSILDKKMDSIKKIMNITGNTNIFNFEN